MLWRCSGGRGWSHLEVLPAVSDVEERAAEGGRLLAGGGQDAWRQGRAHDIARWLEAIWCSASYRNPR